MRRLRPTAWLVLALSGCAAGGEGSRSSLLADLGAGADQGAVDAGGDPGDGPVAAGGGADADTARSDAERPPPDAEPPDAEPEEDARLPPPDGPPDPDCPLGAACNPIPVDALPFDFSGDTTDAPADTWDRYACAADNEEGGGEFVFRVVVPERGYLTATVDDVSGDDVDVDVHLLTGLDPDTCVARDNRSASRLVDVGVVYVVADTWTDGDGADRPGPFNLHLELRPQVGGDCAMQDLDLLMVWRDCDPSLDCIEREDDAGQLQRYLRTPAVGPVVKEAHLVTEADDFGGGWPSSFRDGIDAHYAASEAATGYMMDRGEPWAPAGEGGSEYGQGSFGRPMPVLDEAWYVNMYWRRRPEPGTRMLVQNPETGRSVVAAAGYETGPGSNTAVGGASEEIHDWLGSGHRTTLLMGFLVDQDLPLGPIECD